MTPLMKLSYNGITKLNNLPSQRKFIWQQYAQYYNTNFFVQITMFENLV